MAENAANSTAHTKRRVNFTKTSTCLALRPGRTHIQQPSLGACLGNWGNLGRPYSTENVSSLLQRKLAGNWRLRFNLPVDNFPTSFPNTGIPELSGSGRNVRNADKQEVSKQNGVRKTRAC